MPLNIEDEPTLPDASDIAGMAIARFARQLADELRTHAAQHDAVAKNLDGSARVACLISWNLLREVADVVEAAARNSRR